MAPFHANRLKLDLDLQILILIAMKIDVFQNVQNIQYLAVIYASRVIEPLVAQVVLIMK